jgi:segregation and condensation protein B
LEKELILISGRNEHAPGKPLVYATSKNFMDYFGINSAADLPKIREVLAEQLVEGTRPEDFTNQPIAEHIGYDAIEEEAPTENISTIAVNQDGELIIPEESSNSEENQSTETPLDFTDPEEAKDPSEEAGEEEKPE